MALFLFKEGIKINTDYKFVHTVDSGNIWLKETNIVGRCNYKLHKGFMTGKSVEKNCPFLQKYSEKPYWQNLRNAELQKAKNKIKKQNKKNQKKTS